MPDEYDDGHDSAASFEAAGADREEDCEDPLDSWEDAQRFFGLSDILHYTTADKVKFVRYMQKNLERPYMLDERLKICRAMIDHGGSFAAAIGKALLVADGDNIRRLEQAFPELLRKYLSF